MSLNGFDTGRVGFPPANEKPKPAPSSTSRSDGNCCALARTASRRGGGTRWAWQSMIIPGSLLRVSEGGFSDRVAYPGRSDGQFIEPNPEWPHRIVYCT